MVFSLKFDKDNIPDFLVMLEKQAPGTLKEVEPLVSLAEQFLLLIPKNDHMRAIQAQCDVAMEVYGGILSLMR
jgi:hypothetical protein